MAPSIYIESEGDIELGIQYCTQLSETDGAKFLTLCFPTTMLYKVFIESLIEEAKKNNIEEFGIDLNIVIPSKE